MITDNPLSLFHSPASSNLRSFFIVLCFCYLFFCFCLAFVMDYFCCLGWTIFPSQFIYVTWLSFLLASFLFWTDGMRSMLWAIKYVVNFVDIPIYASKRTHFACEHRKFQTVDVCVCVFCVYFEWFCTYTQYTDVSAHINDDHFQLAAIQNAKHRDREKRESHKLTHKRNKRTRTHSTLNEWVLRTYFLQSRFSSN